MIMQELSLLNEANDNVPGRCRPGIFVRDHAKYQRKKPLMNRSFISGCKPGVAIPTLSYNLIRILVI